MKIITRGEAAVLGLTKYYTGKQCPQHHDSQRRVAGGACVQCTLDKEKSRRHKLGETK